MTDMGQSSGNCCFLQVSKSTENLSHFHSPLLIIIELSEKKVNGFRLNFLHDFPWKIRHFSSKKYIFKSRCPQCQKLLFFHMVFRASPRKDNCLHKIDRDSKSVQKSSKTNRSTVTHRITVLLDWYRIEERIAYQYSTEPLLLKKQAFSKISCSVEGTFILPHFFRNVNYFFRFFHMQFCISCNRAKKTAFQPEISAENGLSLTSWKRKS